jgi:OOP family OmpA-OmpF porin
MFLNLIKNKAMLKNNIITSFIILFAFSLQAQENLIPNGDFEQSQQPNSFMVEGENYDKNMEHWHSPYMTSSPDVISDNYRPDFYPDRRDDVTHYKGKACTGIIIEKSRSEYFGVKLNKEVEAGKKYKLTVHVAIYKGDDDILDNILGVLFMSEKLELDDIQKYSKLPMTPQFVLRKQQETDHEKWVKFDVYFAAKKNYEYLYIGNFKRHRIEYKKYLFIDDISLTELKRKPENNIVAQVKNPVVEKPIILENVTFNYDSSNLNQSSFSSLNKLLQLLNTQPNISIKIIGHTDNIGNEVYNKKLSEDRAKAIYDYLIEHNITTNRLSYTGEGSLKPRASNDIEAGRKMNRRVEYEIVK